MKRAWPIGLLLVACACASTPVPTSDPGTAARGPAYRAAVATVATKYPELPIAVPLEAPSGYAYRDGPGSTPEGGYATTTFDPIEDDGLPTIQVCVLAPEVEPEGTCYADEDQVIGERFASPYRVLIVSTDLSRVTIARPYWRGIEFTTEWEDVAWLGGEQT